MPDFEVLDAKIASALNRIIHNTQFKRKVSLEEQKAQKEDRFLRGRNTGRLPDLRELPGHWSQRFLRKLCRPTNSLLVFEMTIFRNSIQIGTEFYYQ